MNLCHWFFLQISYNEGKLYAEEISAIFMETSAKTGENVQDLFLRIGKQYTSFNLNES